jgi:serine/threonine protein kinase
MPTLGRYVLERRIASGGMADVFMARMIGAYGFEKRVALKVLKPEIAADSDHVRMFVREALVAAEFRHPNLAQVYEVGEDRGRLFIAMELVRGVSLAAMLKLLADKGGGMPMNAMLRIASDALDGLSSAHEARDANDGPLGLVHRDVSPQNIMVGVDGVTKVVDFGIARAEAAFGRTIAPRVKGKFSYMAPEQWKAGGALDARADLFALGVVLYEGTTGGSKLFKGDGPRELFRAVTMDPIPLPSTRVPGYPRPLEVVVMKALARDPNERYARAQSLREALLDVARRERWSLANRVVADVLREALGTAEIEQLWPPLHEGEVLEQGESTSVDEPTRTLGRRPEVTVAIPLVPHDKSALLEEDDGDEPRVPAVIPAAIASANPGGSLLVPPPSAVATSHLAPDAETAPSDPPPGAGRWSFGVAGFALGLAAGAFTALGLTQIFSR